LELEDIIKLRKNIQLLSTFLNKKYKTDTHIVGTNNGEAL